MCFKYQASKYMYWYPQSSGCLYHRMVMHGLLDTDSCVDSPRLTECKWWLQWTTCHTMCHTSQDPALQELKRGGRDGGCTCRWGRGRGIPQSHVQRSDKQLCTWWYDQFLSRTVTHVRSFVPQCCTFNIIHTMGGMRLYPIWCPPCTSLLLL